MLRYLTGVSAALFVAFPCAANAAGAVGFVPNNFTDDQFVEIRVQDEGGPPRQARVQVRVYDGASTNDPVIFSARRRVTLPGGRASLDFKPTFPLGQKATGTKLRAEAEFMTSTGLTVLWRASKVITKQCKQLGSGKRGEVPVTCRWAHFSQIPVKPPPPPPDL